MIAIELSGWLQTTVMSAWQEMRPSWVNHQHFVDQLQAILEKWQIVRERPALLIPVTDDKVGGEKGRASVKQLYLIADDDAVVDTAIGEFIRCNTRSFLSLRMEVSHLTAPTDRRVRPYYGVP